VRDGVCDFVIVMLAVCVKLAVCVMVGLSDSLGVLVTLGVEVALGVCVNDAEMEGLCVWLFVAETLGVCD